eukprot:1911783-Rhodomonas_salina.1
MASENGYKRAVKVRARNAVQSAVHIFACGPSAQRSLVCNRTRLRVVWYWKKHVHSAVKKRSSVFRVRDFRNVSGTWAEHGVLDVWCERLRVLTCILG